MKDHKIDKPLLIDLGEDIDNNTIIEVIRRDEILSFTSIVERARDVR